MLRRVGELVILGVGFDIIGVRGIGVGLSFTNCALNVSHLHRR
jgi:hypothetical protein